MQGSQDDDRGPGWGRFGGVRGELQWGDVEVGGVSQWSSGPLWVARVREMGSLLSAILGTVVVLERLLKDVNGSARG
jgi:hypothetical protein